MLNKQKKDENNYFTVFWYPPLYVLLYSVVPVENKLVLEIFMNHVLTVIKEAQHNLMNIKSFSIILGRISLIFI